MKKLFSMLLCGAMLVSFSACESSSNDELEGTLTKHDYVDLGLPSGILWATCNIGATNPEDYGDYFAWGETTSKETYNWDTYKYGTFDHDNPSSDYSTITKYNLTDGKIVIETTDDVATANWGGAWRIPTYAELNELRSECVWTWTTHNGVNGYQVKSKNGNSIFLPAAGYRGGSDLIVVEEYGYYWSSSLYPGVPVLAYNLFFISDGYEWDGYHDRCLGFSIRPVCSSR